MPRAVGVLRAAAVLASALALGSCNVLQFIFGSVFPTTLTLIQSRVDLSSKITADYRSSYVLRVVEAGAYGYVVLTPTGSSGALFPIFFMDLDLNLKKTLTGATSGGVALDGFTGDIVVGNQVLNPSDLTLVATMPYDSYRAQGTQGPDGFYSPTPGRNVANVSMSYGGNTLGFDNFDASWNRTTASPGPALSSTQKNLFVSAVLEDDSRPADPVILAVNPGGVPYPTTYFVSVHRDYFDTSSYAGAAGLLDSAPHRDNLLANTIGLSSGRIIGWDFSLQSFVSLDPATLETTGSFYAPGNRDSSTQIRYAYRVSGGSFYSFDPQTCVVTEYKAWW
jgi:hypothetical protein